MINQTEKKTTCRFCDTELKYTFVDLGVSPLSNSYLTAEQLSRMEPFYPLHAYVCHRCFLVQLEEFESPENIFNDYAYFSSYSESWLRHARDYTEQMIERFQLGARSQVIEIASNDGYLLQYFVKRGVPALGIEPAANVARVAEEKGVQTLTEFFGTSLAGRLAAEGKHADLLLGNNVLAHVPALNDFVAGLKILLKPGGVITMEFPHLLTLMQENQFDTIYHEHFSYFSFLTVEEVFARHKLVLFDVEELETHGGSLRIYARHADDESKAVRERVEELRERESFAGTRRLETYLGFSNQVEEAKRALLSFLIEAKRGGKRVAGYGAPAKGNTLLNYCGIRTDFLDYTVDASPYKQGRFLPGTRIPIHHPDKLKETRPDYVLILPWNLREEIMAQSSYVREWGARFVLPIPRVEVIA
ncbi:MAG: methyltransferase domain-containing protein [Pyrinomonadaceae bacterium]|nr:methyltransferase domain-containing protein [Pyrinomonadaceae bacterium]